MLDTILSTVSRFGGCEKDRKASRKRLDKKK
jgi:hypothetical protein